MRHVFHLCTIFFLLICITNSQLPRLSSMLFKVKVKEFSLVDTDAESEESDTQEEKEQEEKEQEEKEEDLKEKLPKWFDQLSPAIAFFNIPAPLYPSLDICISECYAELLTPPPRMM